MNQLTAEQIKTLEDVFASYPEDYTGTRKYSTIGGIQEQLDGLNEEPGDIFYVSQVRVNKENNEHSFSIDRMIVGETK